MYTDIHTHILPGIDDGAPDPETSRRMLELEKKSGTDNIVLTPHYYMHRQSIGDFAEKRADAFGKISSFADGLGISLKTGAEVLYTPSLADADLSALCIEGTRYMLTELPYRQLTKNFINEFRSFTGSIFPDIIPILAHAERYLDFTDENSLYEIMDTDMYVQVNSGGFRTFAGHTRFIYDLVRSGRAHLLGTDCHNTTTRPPDMDTARKAISRKISAGCFEKLMRNAGQVFSGKSIQA